MSTTYHIVRFRNKINLLANSQGVSELTQVDFDKAKADFIDIVSKTMGANKLQDLQREIDLVRLDEAFTRCCRKCNSTQSIDQFYARADGSGFLERCRSCNALQWQKDKNFGQNFFSHSLSSAKKRAASKGLAFDIDVDYLNSIFPRNKKCPILGITMKPGARGNNATSPSLDKVIPEKGYIKGNVWYISMRANRIKSDHTLSDILATAYGIHKKLTEIGRETEISEDFSKHLKMFAQRIMKEAE